MTINMKHLVNIKISHLVVWMSLACGAHAQTSPDVTEPLGQNFKVPQLLVNHQTRLILYRLATEKKAGAVSVYINGEYQASLQRGAFTELCLPPATVEVGARMTENGQSVADELDVTNSLILEGGKEAFVRVQEAPTGRATLMLIRAEKALPEVVKTRAQLHTLSRVTQAVPCEDLPKSAAPKAPAKAARSITLGADALFPFGKSDVESIPPKGRRILDHLIDRIKSEFGSGKALNIHITGHADSFGTEAGNLKLSKQRAAAIKAYFVTGGLMADNITANGRGDKDLVITSCGKSLTKDNVACNKPNRRVVIEVSPKQVVNANN
jgi:OOP family OmpA-OmpF porin